MAKKKVRSHKRRKKGGSRKTRTVRGYDRTMRDVTDLGKLAIGAAVVTSITATTVSALKK
jgi:hypothetical protein